MEEVSPPPLPPEPESPRLDPSRVAMVATAVAFVAFLLSSVVALVNVAFSLWFTQAFAFLGVGWFLLRVTGREPGRYTGLVPPRLAPAAFGFAVGTANLVAVAIPLQYLSQTLMPVSWRDIYDVAGLFRGQSPVEMAAIMANVAVCAPLCEEFFFRGVLLQGLRSRGGPPLRMLVISAVIFSAFHLDPVGFLGRVELGVLFGWLLLRTGSLWPAVLAHMANNLVSTVLFFSARGAEVERGATGGSEVMTIGALMLVGGAALWGLQVAARHYPALLGGPPPSPERLEAPEAPVQLEPTTQVMWRAVPWVLGATLALGVYVVADPVGVQLSQVDLRYPLEPVPKKAPDAIHAEREALFNLRVRAHRGEIPVEEYMQERARQSEPKKAEAR